MKGYLKYIALIDNKRKLHYVEFTTGVNIITGKSCTGKSAMIEIFDYCFGNSVNTVPEGVITDNADLYFIILSIKEFYLILARNSNSNKAFLTVESLLPKINEFNMDYFDESKFLPLKDFKDTLGRYFGIDIVDTDDDLNNRRYRVNNAKAPRPSVRHFTSFMFQHQNLIANKHSLFYRFDEKEKREQTIDQFKIFASFVSQDYFIKNQQINELKQELRELENKRKAIISLRKEKESKISEYLREFHYITGKPLLEDNVEAILLDPANTLQKIQTQKITGDLFSHKYLEDLEILQNKVNIILAKKREKEISLRDVNNSIKYAETFKNDISNISTINEANLHLSECPFCKQTNEDLASEANKLDIAINWLNDELSKTPLLLDSFISNKKELESQIKEIDSQLRDASKSIEAIKKSIEALKLNKSIEEQAQKIKLKIENTLEEKIVENTLDLDTFIKNKYEELNKIQEEINASYNPVGKIKAAEKYIIEAMNEIGENFDFEKTYKPVNLKFSLSSFELWYQKDDNAKVYLRSMGSGANWLYCHVSLFTAIHKYFCSIGDKSLIPPILFFDQPSQVYFPASIDNNDKFDAKSLKEQEGKLEKLDDDLSAVSNLFNQLVKFCINTGNETGIIPQIIITDHADNLKLDDADFESLVNGRRWRTHGFINIDGANSRTTQK